MVQRNMGEVTALDFRGALFTARARDAFEAAFAEWRVSGRADDGADLFQRFERELIGASREVRKDGAG